MQRPNSDASLTISKQISNYILSRAREQYLARIRTEALNDKSIQVSKEFPVHCTQRMMELVSFQPTQHTPGLAEEQQLSPLESCRDYHRPLRTTTNTPRLSVKTYDRTIFNHKDTKKQSHDVVLRE
jgi:hypothetical protein